MGSLQATELEVAQLIKAHGVVKFQEVLEVVNELSEASLQQVLYISRRKNLSKEIYCAMAGKEPEEKVAIMDAMVERYQQERGVSHG